MFITTANLQLVSTFHNIQLTSSLPYGQGACPGDTIMFTCITYGSASHAWISEEYIGTGGLQLEFATYHNPGEIASNAAEPDTYAELLVRNETLRVLKSQLHVTVTSSHPSANVSCLFVDTHEQNTTGFQLLGKFHKTNGAACA